MRSALSLTDLGWLILSLESCVMFSPVCAYESRRGRVQPVAADQAQRQRLLYKLFSPGPLPNPWLTMNIPHRAAHGETLPRGIVYDIMVNHGLVHRLAQGLSN